jgi:hypothetical protein
MRRKRSTAIAFASTLAVAAPGSTRFAPSANGKPNLTVAIP